MAGIILANSIVFIIVMGITGYIGLDLKKWSSWLYGIYGFLSGFLLEFLVFNDDNTLGLSMNLTGSLQAGSIFAFLIVWAGVTRRWQRQCYNIK